MKARLPKALLSLLALVAISTAQAGYISPTTIWTETGEMQLGTNPDNVAGYTIDVKDGDTEATITKDVTSTSGLFVRDGQLTIGGTEYHNTVTINPNDGGQLDYINGTPEVLNVAGKDAVVVIDNATVTTNTETASAVGGPDGNGTLIIQNGAKYIGTSQLYFFVGYKSYRLEGENPDSSASGTPVQIIHATTNNVGDSRTGEDGEADYSNRYTGTYTEGANGTEFGKGVVIVTDNSQFDATGIKEFCLGHGELHITENSTMNTSALPTCIGYGIGATSLVNIEDGSVWNINGQLHTGNYGDSTAIINVKNATVNLNNKKGAFLGLGTDPNPKDPNSTVQTNTSTTEFNLLEGGKLNVSEELYIGYTSNAKMTVAKTAVIKDFGNIHTKGDGYDDEYIGTPLDRLIIEAAGTLENAGTIEMYTVVNGGEFIMVDGAVAESLTSTSGTVNLSGNVTFTGDVEIGGTTRLTFDLGSTMNLDGHVFTFTAGTIYVEIGDLANVDAASDVLFTLGYTEAEALQFAEGTMIQLVQNGVNYGEAVNLQVGTNVATRLIPEPATATLSLLALMGLAARRRRK